MGELKERFLSVYNNAVHRDGSDMLLRWLEDSDFFVAPASTKFHGCHEGGLLQHSLNVYDCLKRGLANAGLQNSYPEETVAVVSLLHDICKVNFYKKGFRNVKDEETGQWYKKEVYEIDEKFPCGEHADKSVILIQNIGVISDYMSKWNDISIDDKLTVVDTLIESIHVGHGKVKIAWKI